MKREDLIGDVRRRLKEQADPRRAEGEQRYFKGTIRSYGVKVPQSFAIAREILREHKGGLSSAEWLDLCERLLADGWFEEGHIGLEIAVRLRLPPSQGLFATYERWLTRYVGNWAHCDKLGTGLIAPVVTELPALVGRVRSWTDADNRWRRRGSAVSLIPPARRGLFLEEALEIAGALLEDGDDLVQKGYGWLLREAAEQHPVEVTSFLERHVRAMPRTAFRYAIEKFPPAERKRLMAL